ncbi:tumor susceptibility gene 101 protein-like isoform X2 [Gigantopelta aegis]|uniref:tumor susceptibility gene 101 protein-like isoform X2 n=1 Tax=Gigantopelta aegis TaxID=1735272 RepID=UPI001B88991D|nr:tumor susceptibility gene 101 protein-like isoform X2 [Gigantopelta aegis]
MSKNYEAILKSALSKYKNADATKREVLNVLSRYADLRPQSSPFVFNDGTEKQLLNLEGTIPVPYKGNNYNIPVCIWILDTHPYNPPMAYVRPTPVMQIKPNRYVDANGKVDLPYLREWKHGSSDLFTMIQILTVNFSDECPVFSRMAPPRPPVPYPAPGQPPYPTGQIGMPMPGSNPSFPTYPGGNPPYPPQGGGSSTNIQPPPYPASSYPNQNFGSYPPAYPAQQNAYSGSQPTPYPASYPYGSNPQTPYPAATSYPGTTPTVNNAVQSRPSTGTVTEAHIKASLLSAVEDKIRRRLKETFAQAQAEMDVLRKTQSELVAGKEKLERMISDLEREKTDVEENIKTLREKDNEVKEAVTKLENSGPLDIDEAVVTTTPLYRQLLNSFAEEQALEDAIYYLGEAIRKNVIDLDVFLKQVRELSRQQFMLRALIQKCREKAGLPQFS